MTALPRSLVRAARRGWLPGAALACSGGHDSTALLLLAVDARQRGAIGNFVVLHIDHGTRQESHTDAQFVADLCRETRTPFAQARLRWPVGAARLGEDELRRRRYASLALLTARLGLAGVVTAHTRDDQVETVLMRLLCGAAPLAAAGMRERTTLPTDHGALIVVRPLLDVSRAELDDVLAIHGVTARVDPSNADARYRRNALRCGVVPQLREISPGFESALLRSGLLAARDAAYVDALAQDVFPKVVSVAGCSVAVERAWLAGANAAMATRVLRLALQPLIDTDAWRELSFERLEALRRAAGGRTGARIELPGAVVATVERHVVVFLRVERDARGHNAAPVGEP